MLYKIDRNHRFGISLEKLPNDLYKVIYIVWPDIDNTSRRYVDSGCYIYQANLDSEFRELWQHCYGVENLICKIGSILTKTELKIIRKLIKMHNIKFEEIIELERISKNENDKS